MDIIVGCEVTQAVTEQLRKNGHNAFSCDIKKTTGNHPEWHIQEDLIKVIEKKHWDAGIFFPPCTHLASSGAAYFEEKIKDGRQQKAIEFFLKIARSNINHIAIENPVGVMSTYYRFPDQIIHPYYFGDPYEKRTCIWVKNLPLLKHTKEDNLFEKKTHVTPEERYYYTDSKTGKIKSQPRWYALTSGAHDGSRGDSRSKTFPGIAEAMGSQWGKYLTNYEQKL